MGTHPGHLLKAWAHAGQQQRLCRELRRYCHVKKKEKLQLVTQQAAHAGHILCQRFDRFVATISTDSTSDTPPLQRHLLPLDLEDVASQL